MMRKNSLFILLLVALLSLPASAFAAASTDELSGGKGVGWQGIITSGDDAGLYGAAGRARNKYNMACWVMGKNPLTIADEVRSKLSDPNYGGRFYEYANTFESIPSWEYVPEWQPTYANLTYVLYGFDFQWESAVSPSLYEGAKEDFRRVLAGEDLGGGSVPDFGGAEGASLHHFTFTHWLRSTNQGFTGAVRVYKGFPNDWTGAGGYDTVYAYGSHSPLYGGFDAFLSPLLSGIVADYQSRGYTAVLYGSSSDDCRIYPKNLSGGVGFDTNSFSICFYPASTTFSIPTSNFNGVELANGSIDARWSGTMYRYNSLKLLFLGGKVYFDLNNDNKYYQFASSDAGVSSSSNSNHLHTCSFYSFLEGVTPPVIPPSGDWPEPETPVTPTAPEIPTPTAPTVEPDPTPTEPTPTWPETPTPTAPIVVTVETPEGLDYTQLLTLINDNLNDINSYTVAINSSLNSLRSDLVTEFEGVTQGLRNIYQYLQHLDDLLERHCKHLRDALDDGIYNLELYIKSLFEWLPQQLDFDAKFDYDDTAVTSLLRRILGKIPGGSGDAPTSYMPNPQSDEPGFFDWLTDLWHRFLIDLVSVLPDELGGLVDAFSQLTHYFPFSIPWDLAALLALFEHEPVTPVFDVPWGFGGDEGEIEMVRVDLSAWDGVMEMVRPVFVVGFCWQLAMITKELLGNFDIKQGGV